MVKKKLMNVNMWATKEQNIIISIYHFHNQGCEHQVSSVMAFINYVFGEGDLKRSSSVTNSFPVSCTMLVFFLYQLKNSFEHGSNNNH